MIDWDFETRLVDRIAAREVIAAAQLTPRQQQVLCDWARSDDTQRAIAERAGLSGTRVGQIVVRSLRRMKARAYAEPLRPEPPPRPTLRASPPPGFDRAAFIRHMRGLKAHREAKERLAFAKEQASLEALMNWGGAPPPLLPPPPVEPWFDLSRMPTLQDLQQIGQYALNYFTAVYGPLPFGLLTMGAKGRYVVCLRDADAIAGALNALARAVPLGARFSAQPLAVPEGLLGATAATHFAAVRVVSLHAGKQVALDLTWDDPAQ